MTTDNTATFIDMGEVVDLLRTVHGVAAHVEHTGGGNAAILAGPTRPDPDGDPTRDVLYAAIAGPGYFEAMGNDRDPAYLGLDEVYVGPHDHGDATPLDLAELGATTAAQVAAVIAAQTHLDDPTRTLDAVTASALVA